MSQNSNGNLAASLEFLTLLSLERPDDPSVHSDIGAILHQMWRLDEATVHMRLAVEKFQDSVDAKSDRARLAMNNLGVALKDQGRSGADDPLDQSSSL